MNQPVTVKWTGLKEVDEVLSVLERKTGKKIAAKAIRAGLTIMAREIRKRAPIGATKRLKKSISGRFRKTRDRMMMEGKAGINVGRKKSDKSSFAPHGHLYVLGTKNRQAKSRNKKPMSFPANRGRLMSNNFVRHGVNAALPQLKNTMATKALSEVVKEVQALGKH